MLKTFSENNMVWADKAEAKYPGCCILMSRARMVGSNVEGVLKAVSTDESSYNELMAYRDSLPDSEKPFFYGGEYAVDFHTMWECGEDSPNE